MASDNFQDHSKSSQIISNILYQVCVMCIYIFKNLKEYLFIKKLKNKQKKIIM